MNEMLEQFVIESRELVAQATDQLLRGRSPADPERLDTIFRAFHTLKGSAGIVEFGAMERTVHAIESVLSEIRSGGRTLTDALVGECVACLDHVARWLDWIDAHGELPLDDSRSDAGAGKEGDWVEGIRSRHPQAAMEAATALRYVPEGACFFRGEDPLARVAQLPHLLAVELSPLVAWPSLPDLDPYACNLVLTALSRSSAADLDECMRGGDGDIDIVDLSDRRGAGASTEIPALARSILEAQRRLMTVAAPGVIAGVLASAGRVAENVLRACGLGGPASDVREASERSVREETPQALSEALTRVLSGDAPTPSPASEPPSVSETVHQTLRVDAARIDRLVRLTGELTVAKNALGHTVRRASADGGDFAGALREGQAILDRLIGELQKSVLSMRVLPLGTVFQRFPRVLRELSAKLGKAVTLQIEGEDTEADKAIVELLFEPLLHVLRNAIDHGVEETAVRAGQGKPTVATIRLSARREGDRVAVEIEDDGGGIDVERVRAVARTQGLGASRDLDAMSDEEAIDLIFAAGFSTATGVTELSGRGVGMDAVRSAIERVGGRVSVRSRKGEGTTVRFSLPFSIMLSQVMTVEAGGQAFGIPIDALSETVHMPYRDIVGVGKARIALHRERTLPILDLADLLGTGPIRRDETTRDAVVVIASCAGQSVGIQVDRAGERMDIILKPLEGLLAQTPGITGTALLGDGRVLLVLDVEEILQ